MPGGRWPGEQTQNSLARQYSGNTGMAKYSFTLKLRLDGGLRPDQPWPNKHAARLQIMTSTGFGVSIKLVRSLTILTMQDENRKTKSATAAK